MASPRRTRNQDRILQILGKQTQPLSAQDLYLELRNHQYSTGLATVYRSLEALKLQGAIKAQTLSNGEAVYSLPQVDRHYLTCLRCDRSIPLDGCPIHALEGQLTETYQFRIFYHTLEFFGLCPDCQALESPLSPQSSQEAP